MSDGGVSPPSFRWRARSFLLFGAGAGMLAFGVGTTDPALLFLGLPIVLAPVAAALLGPRLAPRATLAWHVEGSERDVRIVGAITVEPPTRASDIRMELPAPGGIQERAPPVIERRDREIRFTLFWDALDPVIVPVPPPRIAWRDPAGLVERRVAWSPPELLIERYPPELLRIGAVRLERTIALPGETHSRRIGPSGEFFGIRDAEPREPPRRINWKASARAGRLLANEYQLDRTGDVLLVLDTRPTTLGPRVDAHLLALSVAAAHGIAESFLREKARVGLAVFGEFLDVVPLAGGRTQRLRLRRTLLRVRLTTEPGPAERCAVSVRRHFPPGVTTILFSSLANDDSDDLVMFLRRRGFPVLVLSPSPVPLLQRTPVLSDAEEELVHRITRLVRRSRLAHMWQHAPVVDWEEYWSLGGLVELLRRPRRRGSGV